MNVIGLKCCYVGPETPLRERPLLVLGVFRRRRADGSGRHLETDDGEFEDEPLLPEERVRVRICDTGERADLRAADLDVFQHLTPRMMKLDVELEEATAQAVIWAAQTMRRPLDALINDAVAAHVRTLGVGRVTTKTLVGLPAVR